MNWLNVLTEAGLKPQELLDNAQRWHHNFLLKAFPAILLILVLGVWLNAAGWREVNFGFALITMLTGLYFATQPKIMLSVFALGTAWNGLLDSRVSGIKASLDEGIQFVSDKYVRPVGHILLLATVVFVTLGTFPIQNTLSMAVMIVVVMGLGLWAALFASNTFWYRRATLTILLLAFVVSAFGAYVYTQSDTQKRAEQVRSMSDTNLDRRNAKQIEALEEFVAEGGILSPEQRAFLDQKTSEVSPGILPEGQLSQFLSKGDWASTAPGKAIDDWLGEEGWSNWILWIVILSVVYWAIKSFSSGGGQGSTNKKVSGAITFLITAAILAAIVAVIVLVAANYMEDGEEKKPAEVYFPVVDLRNAEEGKSEERSLGLHSILIVKGSSTMLSQGYANYSCPEAKELKELYPVMFEIDSGDRTNNIALKITEESKQRLTKLQILSVDVTITLTRGPMFGESPCKFVKF